MLVPAPGKIVLDALLSGRPTSVRTLSTGSEIEVLLSTG